jgi:ribosome modulation factor
VAEINLPSPGQRPWNLNPAIEAVNTEVEGLTDLVTDGRLSEDGLSTAFVEVGRQSFDRLTRIDVRDFGAWAAGESAAAANTSTLKAALTSNDGDIFIPAGAWYILPGEIVIPNQRKLIGVRSPKYAGIAPTKGTRLLSSAATGSGPLIKLGELAMLSDIALSGPGGAVNYDGVELGKFSTVERVVVRGFRDGIAGAYSNACTIRDVNVFSNTRYGLRDIVDSGVYGGFFNANGSDGIYLGTGANDNLIQPTKLEWNDGHGVNLYSNYQNVVGPTIIDRNGKTGVAATSTGKTTLAVLTLRRNGRSSASTANDDAHFFLQGNTDLTIVAPNTTAGPDDDGAGYVSPRYVSRENGNTRLNIVGGNWGGSTEAVKRSVFTNPNVDSRETATTGNPYFDKRAAGRAASWSGTVPSGGTGVMTVALPPLQTFSLGDVTDVAVMIRNPSSGGRATGRLPIFRQREAGAATVTVGAPTNIVGAVLGSTITVTAAINADGSELTVTVANGETTDRQIALSV